jgi:hypothetical protein
MLIGGRWPGLHNKSQVQFRAFAGFESERPCWYLLEARLMEFASRTAGRLHWLKHRY